MLQLIIHITKSASLKMIRQWQQNHSLSRNRPFGGNILLNINRGKNEEVTHLCHSLLPERDVVRSEGDSVHHSIGIGLENDAAVDDLIYGEHDDVERVEQSPALNILTQDLADGVVDAVKNGHQELGRS